MPGTSLPGYARTAWLVKERPSGYLSNGRLEYFVMVVWMLMQGPFECSCEDRLNVDVRAVWIFM